MEDPSSTCRPETSPGPSGRASVNIPCAGFTQGVLNAGRICTGFAPWLKNERFCGVLLSPTASAPKSSSGVEGIIALNPIPLSGMANEVLLSELTGLTTVSAACSGNGQAEGGSPPSAVEGNQGQLCCGANEIVMMQLSCEFSAKLAPGVCEQLSCSMKSGSPVKSLAPNGLVMPGAGLNVASEIVRPLSGLLERVLLVSVIVCVLGKDPTCCGGNVSVAGDIRIGCVQTVALPIPRQTSPISPAAFPEGQELVLTP